MEINQEKVLVTGESGYIALHCVSELLNKGYKVKGTVRSESKKVEVQNSLSKYLTNPNDLELVIDRLSYKKSVEFESILKKVSKKNN